MSTRLLWQKHTGRISLVAMLIGRRYFAGTLLLAAVAVAGLLSMHGLDGVIGSLSEQAQSAHGPTGDRGEDDALRFCVFVAAIAGLGLAAAGLTRRSGPTARFAPSDGFTPTVSVPAVRGRSRLLRLCVLRI